MSTITITNAQSETREVTLVPNTNLMELLRDNDYDEIAALCGGCCSCATCHVYIDPDSADLVVMEEDEQALLEDADGYDPGRSRLSCQIVLQDAHAGMSVQLLDAD